MGAGARGLQRGNGGNECVWVGGGGVVAKPGDRKGRK